MKQRKKEKRETKQNKTNTQTKQNKIDIACMGTRNQTSSMVFDWNIIINCNKQNEKEIN